MRRRLVWGLWPRVAQRPGGIDATAGERGEIVWRGGSICSGGAHRRFGGGCARLCVSVEC